MRLKIYRGYDGLKKIENEWNELFNSLSLPIYSQSIIWHKAYLHHLAPNVNRCYYFCIYKENILIAIFPLESIRLKFYLLSFNTLSFSIHSHFGLNSILIDERENTQSTFEFLYKALKKEKSISWDLIYFSRAIDGSQDIHCKINNPRLIAQSMSQACDILSIENYEESYKKFSRNLRRNLRKGREDISKLKNISFKSSRKIETLETDYNHFLDVEASGWKGSNGEGSAIKLDDNLRNFYSEVMKGFSENKQIEINILFINNEPISAQYAIILEPNVFLLKIGFDEKKRSLSPGNLLIEYKFKEYETNPNLTTLNLITDATWHTQWKPIVLKAYKIFNCKHLYVALYIKLMLWIKYQFNSIKTNLNNYY